MALCKNPKCMAPLTDAEGPLMPRHTDWSRRKMFGNQIKDRKPGSCNACTYYSDEYCTLDRREVDPNHKCDNGKVRVAFR